jgi:uncharacterized membrane protein YkvA (DUF1232 family)
LQDAAAGPILNARRQELEREMDDKVLYGEILGPEVIDPRENVRRAKNVRHKFWATFRKAVRAIPFSEDLVAAYYCAFDPTTPARVRGVLLAALAYFVLPLDTIPDFIAGIGFTDDIGVLIAAIAMVGSHINDSHREKARRALAGDAAD